MNSILFTFIPVNKDLGIIFSSNLSFNEHMDFINKKASQILGFISCNSSGFSNPKTLYVSLVRSVLEYGLFVWAPYQNSSIVRLNKIQQTFLNIVLHCCGLQLDMQSLTDRHRNLVYYCQGFIYNLLNGFIDFLDLKKTIV